ncbi:MAG: homocysteine S-methyltransferase family protein [Balneolaceae bacterium]|nr:homocysteine S-methyltransferase family protein [Balneolaceae bacterium]MBO6546452.1 homocysteine S-methyltransferase family protein [Balneolaceae bacterium]MBO6648811.1 homocysteine S-methyltransferase family protein [Balneolaceae bacterium]
MDIKKHLQERILVLDGAMGTMIQRYELTEEDFRGERFKNSNTDLKGNNDLLSVTQPQIIKEIHEKYLEAGADIVETNTFSGTTIAQADYELEEAVYDINFESARLAKEACVAFSNENPDKPRFVAGAMGPTNKTASMSPDVSRPEYRAVSFDGLASAYKLQAKGLMDGGADLLLIETVFDTLNAKAAIFGVLELYEETGKELPIMISGTITDASGRTLSGQTVEAFLISLSHAPLLSIGLNCALGAEQLKPYLKTLSKYSPYFISAYPNAGLPNEFGEYDQGPIEMADQVRSFLDDKLVNILGGCCGTTPNHIKKMAELAAGYSPRTLMDEAAA